MVWYCLDTYAASLLLISKHARLLKVGRILKIDDRRRCSFLILFSFVFSIFYHAPFGQGVMRAARVFRKSPVAVWRFSPVSP